MLQRRGKERVQPSLTAGPGAMSQAWEYIPGIPALACRAEIYIEKGIKINKKKHYCCYTWWA